MGQMTRAELMAQAGLEAGNLDANSFIRVWLDTWLARTAKSWSWPLLKKRVTDIAVSTGTASVTIGKGTSTTITGQGTLTTHYVHRLLNGVLFYRPQSGYSPNGRIFVRPLANTDPAVDESVSDPATRRGLPDTCRVRKSADGALTLYLNPVPDRALYLACDVLWVPPAIGAASANDTQYPWYPNDRTLLQACKCAIMAMDAQSETTGALDAEQGKLAAMVVDDRDFDGAEAGDNEVMQYDPSVFQ